MNVDPTPHLSQLLRIARRHLRVGRARHGMMITSLAVAALALLGMLFGQPSVGVLLLPLLPLAGLIAYLRPGGSDHLLAQDLDQTLQTRDLLASGVSCRGRQDEASRMIAAQADAYAARLDGRSLKPGPLNRSEAAAGLVLAIALSACLAFHPAISPSTSARPRAVAAHQADATPPVREQASKSKPDRTPSNRQAERAEADPSDDPAARTVPADRHQVGARDAAGDGRTQTPGRVSSLWPNMGSAPAPVGEEGDTPAAAGSSRRAGSTSSTSADSGLAPRGPLAIDQTEAPPPARRRQAQDAIDAGHVDMDSRDLLRAYFDLDHPR